MKNPTTVMIPGLCWAGTEVAVPVYNWPRDDSIDHDFDTDRFTVSLGQRSRHGYFRHCSGRPAGDSGYSS